MQTFELRVEGEKTGIDSITAMSTKQNLQIFQFLGPLMIALAAKVRDLLGLGWALEIRLIERVTPVDAAKREMVNSREI